MNPGIPTRLYKKAPAASAAMPRALRKILSERYFSDRVLAACSGLRYNAVRAVRTGTRAPTPDEVARLRRFLRALRIEIDATLEETP
jgi:hypothetical protein